MPLSDEQRQAIREEEFFRDQVRKELAGPKKAPGWLERISAFLETKAGFWLLTTVLAGLAATGIGTLQNYLNREAIDKRETAEKLRRDTETLLKLGPMLTSDKPSETSMALVLLGGLMSSDAIDKKIADQVRLLFINAERAGARAGATPQEQANAEAVSRYTDSARVNAILQPGAAASTPATALAKTLDSKALPLRVYLQVASETDTARAERARSALRAAGIIAPGIEVVPAKSVPSQNELRYCADKVDSGALERVTAALGGSVVPAPAAKTLASTLCTNVRYNHFEIWYTRSGG